MITYIPMEAEHISETLLFWKQTPEVYLHENGEDTKAGIEAYLYRNPDCSYIALENGKIIGAILAGHDGRRGLINHLAVAPEYRRQGIGKQLLHLAKHALKKNGIPKCALFVLKENREGIEFYRNIGWKEETIVSTYSKIL